MAGVHSMKKGMLKLFKEEMARGLRSIPSLGVSEVFTRQKWILPGEKFIHNMIAEAKRTSSQW